MFKLNLNQKFSTGGPWRGSRAGLSSVRPAKHLNVDRELHIHIIIIFNSKNYIKISLYVHMYMYGHVLERDS